MPRHRRPTPPVLPACLAVGVLGAASLAPGLVPAPSPAPVATVSTVSPVPEATLPPSPSVRPREAITDLGW